MNINITIEKKHILAIVLLIMAVVSFSIVSAVGGPLAQYTPLSQITSDDTGYNVIDDGTGKINASYLAGGSVPSGGIIMFNTTCPSGWTRFAALDGRVTKGAIAYGATGGSDTHATPYSTQSATCSGGTCWYTSLRNSVGSASSWPPYLEVIWCQKD